MKEHSTNHHRQAYGERNSGLSRSSTPGSARELTPREAVLDRIRLGRPDTSRRWGAIALVLKRYEPAIDMFALHIDWSPRAVWDSATGWTGGHLPMDIRASHMIAIIDLATLWVRGKATPGVHKPHLVMSPTWENGARTTVGAKFDDEMPTLNLRNWRCGVDSQSHRRYFEVDG